MSLLGTSTTTTSSSSPSPIIEAPRPPLWNWRRGRRPRILLVTPELSSSRFLARNGKQSPCVKAGGLADVSASLVDSLSDAGADVHVAMPHFRSIFPLGPQGHSKQLHLCQDREFCYRRSVYDGSQHCNIRASLAFQRDVIHYVMPRIRPDLIHCHDWMTGLVPAAARSMGIPSLFTVHNLHDEKVPMSYMEDRGIDAAKFWQHLYFCDYPGSYESNREHNPVSMLASGILAADQMNTVSNSFLYEMADGGHSAPWPVVDSVRGKLGAGRAHGILNSLPAHFSPAHDSNLSATYDHRSQLSGKRENKRTLQHLLGLEKDDEAPMLFWPSRLDPMQKGCQLLAEILYRLVSDYWALGLQVVFIADGPYHHHFWQIAKHHNLEHRIAVRGFSEGLSRMGYAASDYTLMPSAYEPCGLSQMAGLRYGSLPIVHATGGLRDTVSQLCGDLRTGNGFTFETHDAVGLRWAIDQAMLFHIRPEAERVEVVSRIMAEASNSFPPADMVNKYLTIYRDLLNLR